MKIAVLGVGTMGTTYINNIVKMPDVSLVGVFDENEVALAKAAELGQTKGYTNLDELIEQANPDLVCVCLPTYLHKEFVLKLAAFKKNIVCEKPLALTVDDAIEMERVCLQESVRLFVGHVLRFFPNYVDLKNKVDSGLIGDVKVARAKRYSAFPKGSNDWFTDHAKSGGVILDLMIHDLDFLRWTMGEVKSVYTQFHESEGKQLAYLTLKFQSGAIAQVSGFWGYAGDFMTTAELACEKGLLRLNNLSYKSLELHKDKRQAEQVNETVQVPASPTKHDPYYIELRHFIGCIRNGEEAIISVHDAKQVIAIANAAIESGKLGKPVPVPVVTKSEVTF